MSSKRVSCLSSYFDTRDKQIRAGSPLLYSDARQLPELDLDNVCASASLPSRCRFHQLSSHTKTLHERYCASVYVILVSGVRLEAKKKYYEQNSNRYTAACINMYITKPQFLFIGYRYVSLRYVRHRYVI